MSVTDVTSSYEFDCVMKAVFKEVARINKNLPPTMQTEMKLVTPEDHVKITTRADCLDNARKKAVRVMVDIGMEKAELHLKVVNYGIQVTMKTVQGGPGSIIRPN